MDKIRAGLTYIFDKEEASETVVLVLESTDNPMYSLVWSYPISGFHEKSGKYHASRFKERANQDSKLIRILYGI